jgi:endonuclease YncB( thermonuclease family)
MKVACILGLALLAAPAAQDLHEVVKVVDGDTIHISMDGGLEKLRLLSVDTEEKISGNLRGSASKPETVFGQETTIWAQELFAGLAEDGEPTRVRLRFPEGRRERDVYGRLLCHVILPDGRDFNLLLVELGKSPYFNKYGNSQISHAAFVRAQRHARARKLGVWNPETNRARTAGAPEVLRPYERLLPWWEARAQAIEGFRERHAADPDGVIAADSAEDVSASLERCLEDPERRVLVFGSIERFYEEPDGSLTVRFRNELRASLSATQRGGDLERMLRASTLEYRQNFVYVAGRLTRGPRGARLVTEGPQDWRLADPPHD